MADDTQAGSLEIECEPDGPQSYSSPKMTMGGDLIPDGDPTEKEEKQDQPLDFSCHGRKRSISPSASRSPKQSEPTTWKHFENDVISNDGHSRLHSNSSATDSDNQTGKPRLAISEVVPGSVLPAGMIIESSPNFAVLAPGLSPIRPVDNFITSMAPSVLASMLDHRGSRPFDVYPKDPSSFSTVGQLQGHIYGVSALLPITSAGMSTPGMSTPTQVAISAQALNQNSEEHYHIYRHSQQLFNAQGDPCKTAGHPPKSHQLSKASSVSNHSYPISSTTSHYSRKRQRIYPDVEKDESYWDRRRKNNEAAKRSRDARRAKEDEIAFRAAFLEQENLKLRAQVAALKTETAQLKSMVSDIS